MRCDRLAGQATPAATRWRWRRSLRTASPRDGGRPPHHRRLPDAQGLQSGTDEDPASARVSPRDLTPTDNSRGANNGPMRVSSRRSRNCSQDHRGHIRPGGHRTTRHKSLPARLRLRTFAAPDVCSSGRLQLRTFAAPGVGLEPTTYGLTARARQSPCRCGGVDGGTCDSSGQ
jgi:hypothetical protein